MVPVLETPRLILRAHRPDDFPACAAMWADPVVTRHIGGRPLSGEEAWTKALRYAGHWAWMDFGYWAIEDKATGEFLGETGFADYKRNLKSSAKGLPEMGWILVSGAHGRGIGTEAVTAAVAWGDARFGRTCSIIDPGNAASIRLAEKMGFRELERTLYHGQETVVFDRTAELDEVVEIAYPDAAWAGMFAVEAARLGTGYTVEHIGSTAVPGLAARPVIDIMAGVAGEDDLQAARRRFAELGYLDLGAAGVPGRIYLRQRNGACFNIALVVKGGAIWHANLALREYLRGDATAAEEYVLVKRSIVANGADTLLAYSVHKGPTVERLIAQALINYRKNETP